MVQARLSILTFLVALPFCALLVRLASLQLVPSVHEERLRQSEHLSISHIPPKRGRILARGGEVLAGNVPSFNVHFVYSKLNPRDRLLAILAGELEEEFGSFYSMETMEAKILELADPEALATRHALPRTSETEEWLYLLGPIQPRVQAKIIHGWKSSSIARTLEQDHDGARQPRYRTHFAFRPAAKPPYLDLWFSRKRLVHQEIVLLRLADLLAEGRGDAERQTTYERLVARVREERDRHERRVRREVGPPPPRGVDLHDYQYWKKHAEEVRGWCHRERSLLVMEVPVHVVSALEYYPRSFDGLVSGSRSRRVYPQKEVGGSLVGYVVRPGRPREEELRQAGRLIEFLPPRRDLKNFVRTRAGLRSRRDWEGASGLERQYDDELRGLHGGRVVQKDHRNRIVDVKSELPPEDGSDVRTTIDLPLQRLLHDELTRLTAGASPYGGNAASAVVMDLSSGALLACAGVPSIDPNRIRESTYKSELEERWADQTHGWWWDRPTRHAVFPGSVFKIVLATAAMEDAAEIGFSPSRPAYPCNHKFPHFKIHCSAVNGHGLDKLNLVQALKFSCNNYFFSLGYSLLKPQRIDTWARKLGFGRSAGIDLPVQGVGTLGNEKPLIGNEKPLKGVQICQYSIGQVYVKATPLQVVRSLSAIATGGRWLLRPYLVRPTGPPEPLHLENPRTVEAIGDGLWRVAHEVGGTAAKRALGLHAFPVALKTGTADVGKGENLNNAWLVGYAPAGPRAELRVHARIAFAVVIEETQGHGAEVCAPVVQKILEYFASKDPDTYAFDRVRSRNRTAGD